MHLFYQIFTSSSYFLIIFLQEELYGKPVVVADREMVESGAEVILDAAREKNAAFMVVGDALW